MWIFPLFNVKNLWLVLSSQDSWQTDKIHKKNRHQSARKQTDSLIEREQASLYSAKQQVLCHVSQPFINSPSHTRQYTLLSALINTCCRNSTGAYFSWDISPWYKCVCVSAWSQERSSHPKSTGTFLMWCVPVCVCVYEQLQVNIWLIKTNIFKYIHTSVNMTTNDF